MEEVDDDMLSPDAREARTRQRAAQVRDVSLEQPGTPGARQGSPPQGRVVPELNASEGTNEDDDSTTASDTVTDDRALRSALDNMLRVNKITVQPCYSQVLDEVVLAGIMGKDILMDMSQDASVGDNPSPDEGVITRPITQGDVKVMAARLA